MSKRKRDDETKIEKLTKFSDDFFKLSFVNSHNNILNFVESYVKHHLLCHKLFQQFIDRIDDSNFIVVDSLNMSMWTDHYQIVLGFIKCHTLIFPPDVQNYVDHYLIINKLSYDQKQKYLSSLTIDQKLDVTIGLCRLISYIIVHDDANINVPVFIIIHRTTRVNNLELDANHIIIKISYVSIRTLSEVDDMLCVYMICLLLSIIDQKKYIASIMTTDGYKWLSSLIFDKYQQNVLTQTKTGCLTIQELIDKNKCCVIRQNSINKHILKYQTDIGFMKTIMRGTY
jgi:hypothetical protein